MKVKELIEILKTMSQEADVFIELKQSENLLNIDDIKKCKNQFGRESVEIVADWTDFKLDEEEDYFCKEKLAEWARPN